MFSHPGNICVWLLMRLQLQATLLKKKFPKTLEWAFLHSPLQAAAIFERFSQHFFLPLNFPLRPFEVNSLLCISVDNQMHFFLC